MKKLMMGVALASLALAAGNAQAAELWNDHLRGLDEGLAAGAVPPKGVYFVNDLYWGGWKLHDAEGHATNTKLDFWVEAPILLWSTGYKVLGADFAVAAAQPFDYTNVSSTDTAGLSTAHTGMYNTILVPAILSWALPYDLHAKTALTVIADDASSTPGHPNVHGGAAAGNGFWTVSPEAGLSWLHDGWNLSVDAHYGINFKDVKSNYLSGDEIGVDYTATKTFGKWTAGLGAYTINQLQRDKIAGVSTAGTARQDIGAGPIVGYDFGPASLQAQYNTDLETRNDFGGQTFNLRLLAPLY